MLEITINIQAPELSNAIMALAAAYGGHAQLVTSPPTLTAINGGATPIPPVQQPIANTETPVMQQPIYAGTPVANPGYETQITSGSVMPPSIPPVIGAAAPNLMPPIETSVPTTAPTYTMEQLAVAATQLMDAPGHSMTELTTLLAQYGVQALTQLPKEHYGAFATQLRTMGARL